MYKDITVFICKQCENIHPNNERIDLSNGDCLCPSCYDEYITEIQDKGGENVDSLYK